MGKRFGGDIAGPGGPHDKGQVLFDLDGAIVQDYLTVAKLDTHSGAFAAGLLIEGRLFRSTECGRSSPSARKKSLAFTDLEQSLFWALSAYLRGSTT